jgi:hypothetical protein
VAQSAKARARALRAAAKAADLRWSAGLYNAAPAVLEAAESADAKSALAMAKAQRAAIDEVVLRQAADALWERAMGLEVTALAMQGESDPYQS